MKKMNINNKKIKKIVAWIQVFLLVAFDESFTSSSEDKSFPGIR